MRQVPYWQQRKEPAEAADRSVAVAIVAAVVAVVVEMAADNTLGTDAIEVGTVG